MDNVKVLGHIFECLEAEGESSFEEFDNNVAGGLDLARQAFYDSLPTNDNYELTFDKFVKFNRGALIFEYDTDKQAELLQDWGEEDPDDAETEYYKAIYPAFKALFETF